MLVDQLSRSPLAPEIVIAATTDTGIARARELWFQKHEVVRYPFDLSLCVNRFLKAVAPDMVVLVELEVWPNFVAACAARKIPVAVVNGRLTQRSFRRYRRIRWLVRPMFKRLAAVATQNTMYANHFVALGAPVDGIHITGTMKWDTAQIADEVPGAKQLACEMGIDPGRPLIVAGSTAPDEHRLLHEAAPVGVQLLCAPRKPEWFDQAALDLPGCVRRSQVREAPLAGGGTSHRFLLDSIGELRKAYSLADVVVIGRSFGNLHGSDMMEPIALGKPTVVGPAVADFQDTVDALLEGRGVIQITRDKLPMVLRDLLENPAIGAALVENGRRVITAQQGATKKNAQLIAQMLQCVTNDPN